VAPRVGRRESSTALNSIVRLSRAGVLPITRARIDSVVRKGDPGMTLADIRDVLRRLHEDGSQ